MITTIINTIIVEIIVSLRVGHVTFLVSALTSLKNLIGFIFNPLMPIFSVFRVQDRKLIFQVLIGNFGGNEICLHQLYLNYQ
jgi:hypothetical protein